MRLSDMTAEALEGALAEAETLDTRREHALRAVARCAGILRGKPNQDARNGIDDWFENESHQVDAEIAFQRNLGEEAPIHIGTANLAVKLGTPLRALALCSDAIGGVASVDLGSNIENMSQVSVLPQGDGYRIMVPLSLDIYHDGWRLLVRKGVLPATLVTASVGRTASVIVNHSLLDDGRRITAIGDDQGGFDVFELELPCLDPWSQVA